MVLNPLKVQARVQGTGEKCLKNFHFCFDNNDDIRNNRGLNLKWLKYRSFKSMLNDFFKQIQQKMKIQLVNCRINIVKVLLIIQG